MALNFARRTYLLSTVSDFDRGTIFFYSHTFQSRSARTGTVPVQLQLSIFFSSRKSAFLFEGPFGKNDIFQICSVDKDLHPDCAVIRPQPMRFHVLFLPLSSLSFERNSVKHPVLLLSFLAQLSLGVVLTLEEGLLVSLLDFYTDFLCQMAARAFSLVSQLIDCAVESASSSVVCI